MLCGVANMVEGRDVIQRDRDRLERWDSANFTDCNKVKCKVLLLDQGNSKNKSRLGGEWRERERAVLRRTWEFWVMRNSTQATNVFAAQKQTILGCT